MIALSGTFCLFPSMLRPEALGFEQIGDVLLVLDVGLTNLLEPDEIVNGGNSKMDLLLRILPDNRTLVACLEFDGVVLEGPHTPIEEQIVFSHT